MRWPCCESGPGQFPARTFIIEVITPHIWRLDRSRWEGIKAKR